jgi:hypothetical protein
VALAEEALAGLHRRAPVDIVEFPRDSATRFFDDTGQIVVDPAGLTWVRLAGGEVIYHPPRPDDTVDAW